MSNARSLRCYLILVATWPGAQLFAGAPEKNVSQIESTIELYFEADESYKRGDLITRSQLEEFQTYLRTTQGNTLATKRRWLHKMLPDNAPLVNIFHRNGRSVLRQAASKLGGYAELDLLSRNGEGRKLIEAAIEANSADQLVAPILDSRETAALERKNNPGKSKRPVTGRIYTVDDYLDAVSSASQPLPAKNSTAVEGGDGS